MSAFMFPKDSGISQQTRGTHPSDGPSGLKPVGNGESESDAMDEGVLRGFPQMEMRCR
jgi:hypothetical protein